MRIVGEIENKGPLWLIFKISLKRYRSIEDYLNKAKIPYFIPFKYFTSDFKSDANRYINCSVLHFIFINVSMEDLQKIERIRGIENILYWLSKPATVSEYQVHAMRRFLKDFKNVSIEKTTVRDLMSTSFSLEPFHCGETNLIHISETLVKLEVPSIGYSIVTRRNTSPPFELHKHLGHTETKYSQK